MASQSDKASRKLSLKKSQLASKACERGKFEEAALLYSEAIALDTNNHVLYANRSAVYIKTKQFSLALEDAKRAAELQPKWSKAHFRQAVALQCMGKYPEAIAAFASAIAHDQKSQQLVSGLIDAALKSPLKENIEKIFTRLKQVNVAQNPFVVVSIIGQELLNAGHTHPAITCLENALTIGTVGLRMRGSVISALTSAYWKIGNLSRSVELMEQDLEICRSLVDHDGEGRVLGNLGNVYLTMKKTDEALAAHRSQLMVASKTKNKKVAATALSSLAHVYVAVADYANAVDSHNKAIEFHKQLKDVPSETRELGRLGAVYLLAGDCMKSIQCHEGQLNLAKTLNSKVDIALAYSNLGGAYNQKGNFKEAAELHGQVLRIAETIADASLEGRACAGLGRAYRSLGNLAKALKYYERQQGVAVKLKDRVMEGRALSSLGIIYLEQGQCLHALKLHKVHLAICQEFGDRAGQGQAYGNMGCAYSALRKYEQAIKYHQMELEISKEVGDMMSEACTHGNLAVAHQGLGNSDEARRHYEQHLAISRTNGDTHNEGVALFNLGNFYSSSGNFRKAIAYYEKYFSLTQTTRDKIGENKACHNLAFAHFSLGNLKEAVKLYERNIDLARDVSDKNTLGRAYCNLGLIHKDLGDFQNALACQNNFQAVSQEVGHAEGECRALGNIGDVYVKMKRVREAVGYYEKQTRSAEHLKDKTLLCQAYGALGHAYKVLGKLDKALACHAKELKVYRDMNDVAGLFKALDHIGTDCSSSGKHDQAFEYFSEQRLMADQAKDVHMQARALGNLGLAKLNSGEYREAVRYFNNQIEFLDRVAPDSLDLGRAQGNLAESLFMLGDHAQAKANYELFLTAAKTAAVPSEQDKAYRGLGNTYRAMGNLQQALFCFENRLVFAHELTESSAKSSAYGELGNLHRTMGNYEQAATCYTQQLKLAKECQDVESESDAECGLGEVHCKMGDYETALSHHENDLRLGDKLQSSMRQSRAFGNLGLVYELMQNYKKASECQEQHLSIAAQVSDRVAKVDAYSSLGRNHYCMTNFAQSISYLKQGLTIAETLGRSEDEATIRYWLGVALCAKKEIDSSLEELYKAAELYESLRDAGIASGQFQFPMHEQQVLCYQVLQRVLIDLGRSKEALVVSERARARDFIDFFLRKQGARPPPGEDWVTLDSFDQIMEVVNKQNGYFVCYSLVLGHVCIWLVVPQQGIVKFHELRLSEDTPELMVHTDSGLAGTSTTWSLLERLIGQIREDIGVEPACGSSVSTLSSSLSGSDLDEPWERGSFDGSPTTRTRFSSDNASVSSMPATLSYLKNGLLKKGLRKLNGVRTNNRKDWLMKPPVQVLYETLIAPIEEFLPKSPQADGSLSDLVLVPQGDLYLVPFSLLKSHSKDHLHKRFSLITVPSVHSLLRRSSAEKPSATRLVVGDPHLPLSLDNFRCNSSVEHEAELVATLFGTKPLVGSDASKEAVCRKAEDADCIHFATNTSWKHSALVLSPNKIQGLDGTRQDSESSENLLPSPVDFLLTASEICQMRLPAKLVVLGCGQIETRNKMTLDGFMGLVRSFLLAGTSCLLVSLWPVPEPAYKLLLQGFYKRFLRGMRASRALAHAVKLVESNKEFAHPSNWAGFVLVGRDVKGPKKTVQLREALTLMIESTAHCREALKVVLHLIDKANQRLLDNNTSLMYTAETSVENKLGDAQGWRDVLHSAGFRFRKAAKSLPDAIFFPLKDDKGKLRQCGDILRALLGLSPTTLQAISKVLFSPSLVKALLELCNSVLSSFAKSLNNVQVPLQLNLWRVTGCHELLASMGFDLLGVGKDEVMLRSGGMNSRRVLQCAVLALNTLTGGLGTDNTEVNGEFPLRRTGSDSSLKSSVSTISSFSYASADRTIEARSYHGSSRRSHASDVETILDELEMCQESSVDPEVNDNIPINPESRALSLDKKPRVRFNTEDESSESPRKHPLHVGKGSPYEPYRNNSTMLPPEVERINGSSLSTTDNGVARDSGSQSFVNIPRRTNGHSNGVEAWESGTMMAKSPDIDKTSYQYPSHFHEYSDSVDSQSSSLSALPGGNASKTPGSINSMQQQRHVNGGVNHLPNHLPTDTVDNSPQTRRGKLRRRIPDSDYDLQSPHDLEPGPLRSRSVSLESGVDEVDLVESERQRDNSGIRHRSNDAETFHAVIQNTRGSRRENTRGGRSNLKSQSRSEDSLLSVGKSTTREDHEPREILSMDVDTNGNSIPSYGSRGLGVNGKMSSDVTVVDGGASFHASKHVTRPYGSKPDPRRKLKVDHLANLENLRASAC